MIDILTCCYSSVVRFYFDHLRQTQRARRFEYSNAVVKECINEQRKKMKPLHCKRVLDAHFSRDSFIQMIAMKMESSFTTLIASRGWYQKSTWKDEALSFKKETDPVALRFHPFSIAFTRKSIEYLTALTVGHILLERS